MIELTAEQAADFTALYDYLRVDSKLPQKADVIVVGGSGVRVDMAEHAAELYTQGRAPVIVFSGFAHPKFNINEAEIMAKRAQELGVPSEAIIVEQHATNTGLNIQLSERALRRRGINARKIILVHKPHMTRRFIATAEAQWPRPQPQFFVTSVIDNFDEYLAREESLGLGERMLRSMLKDYSVMKTYSAQGYQTEQPVSAEAEAAYQRLIAAGFSEQIINHELSTDSYFKNEVSV